MPLPPKRLQPRAYHAFRCIGAECQDTCCSGWLVNVDKATYEAYRRCEDPALGPRLRELVTIRQFRDLPEALLAKGSLESAGIECFLADDNAARVIGGNVPGVRVQVSRVDAEAAKALLDQPIPEDNALDSC